MENRRIVVTGASGFFGHRLIEELVRRNAQSILAMDIRKPIAHPRPDVADFFHQKVKYLLGDITDRSYVEQSIRNVDLVFHIASFGMSGSEMLQVDRIEKINLGGTENVISACKKNNVQYLIYTSTINVIFDGFTPIINQDESFPYPDESKFMDHYSRTKCIAEKTILRANGESLENSRALTTCAIRPGGIYGEGEERHLPRVIDMFRSGFSLFRTGDPNVSKLDWVYVDNLVHGHLLAAEKLLA